MNIPEIYKPQQRILVAYPFSTPCDDFVRWVQDKVSAHGFQVVEPSLQTRSFIQFRALVQSVEGIIALCVPFDQTHASIPSAWVHNYLGGIAAQTDPILPALVISVKNIDRGGLAKLDECRCPVEYPWEGDTAEKEKALTRIETYLQTYFDAVRKEAIPDILQVTVVLVDIVAFTSYEFRSEQLFIADQAKHVLKDVVSHYQQHLLYASDGGDGGYFAFGMDVASITVLQFAQHVIQAFEQHERSGESLAIKVRIAIDCGGVGQGTSVVNWRRSTLIGPPMNTCSRILGHAEENEIVSTERFYQLLCGEKYAGCFSEQEIAVGKRSEQFPIRRYKYTL